MLPSKWINKKRFKKNETAEVNFYHLNEVSLFYKPNKPDNWFFKKYDDDDMGDVYGFEAVAGDLYRFILGKERAAKAQVVEKDGKPAGVISQTNKSGYTEARNISEAIIPKDMPIRNFLTIENGGAEVGLVEILLNERDGILNNNNWGINFKNIISRIDYDQAFWHQLFYKIERIGFQFNKDEPDVNKLNDSKVTDRFYKAVLKMVLLNGESIQAILDRHLYDNDNKEEKLVFLLRRVTKFRADVLQSENFKEYMRTFSYSEVQKECEEFFKHERKHCPERFLDCMQSIRDTFEEIKMSCEASQLKPR